MVIKKPFFSSPFFSFLISDWKRYCQYHNLSLWREEIVGIKQQQHNNLSVIPPSSLITTGRSQMIKLNMFSILEKWFLSLAWNWSRIDLGWDVKVGYDDCRQSVSYTQLMPFFCTYQFLSCSKARSYCVQVRVCVCVFGAEGREERLQYQTKKGKKVWTQTQ